MIKNFRIILLVCMFILVNCESKPGIRRHGLVTAINPDTVVKNSDMSSILSPVVRDGIKTGSSGNCSVFLKDLEEGKYYLFNYYESLGKDISTEMTGELNVWADMEEVFYFDGKIDAVVDESKVQRIGMVIGLRPEMKESYTLLHKYTWPEVLAKIEEGNIRNYSIFLYELDGKYYLFSYFEYVGDDFDADMAIIDSDPASIAWMKFTDAGCQLPIPTRAEGEWWAAMDQVFYNK